MPTDELPLDEVASHPSEVNQPVLVHAAVARITAQFHPISDSRSPTGFGPGVATERRRVSAPPAELKDRFPAWSPGGESTPCSNWRRYTYACSPHGEVRTWVPFAGGRTGL